MSFRIYLKAGRGLLSFQKTALSYLLRDENSFTHALVLLTLISIIAGGLIATFFGYLTTLYAEFIPQNASTPYVVAAAVFVSLLIFIFAFIDIGITHMLARLFDGLSHVRQYFSAAVAMGFWLLVLFFITVIIQGLYPVVGIVLYFLLIAYGVLVRVYVVKFTYALPTGKAVAVVLIPLVVAVLLIITVPILFFAGLATA